MEDLFVSLPGLTNRYQSHLLSYEWNGCEYLELEGCVSAANVKMLIFQFSITYL